MYQNAKGLVGCEINVLVAEPRGRKDTVSKAISIAEFADGPAAAAFLKQVSEKIVLHKVWRIGFRPRVAAGGLAGDLVDVLLLYDAEKNPLAMLGQSAERKQRLALMVYGADWIAAANQPLPTSPSGATPNARGRPSAGAGVLCPICSHRRTDVGVFGQRQAE